MASPFPNPFPDNTPVLWERNRIERDGNGVGSRRLFPIFRAYFNAGGRIGTIVSGTPSPPITIDLIDSFSTERQCSHNRSPIDRALGAGIGNAAGTVFQIGQAVSGDLSGWCGCNSIHTERDKSRLKIEGSRALAAVAACPSELIGNGQLTESAEKCGMQANQIQVTAYRAPAAQFPSRIGPLPACPQIARHASMHCGCPQVRRCPCRRASGIASPP